MKLNINRFLPFTRAEGPGIRACVWVQGCPIRCPDCSTPWMWPQEGGMEIEIEEITSKILELPNIEGITFSGGEPFFQAKPLAEIGKKIKKEKDLSVITFTGYYINEIIEANDKYYNELLSVTDMLIDGPYIDDLPPKVQLTGSSNQNIHFLSSKYINLKKDIYGDSKKVEVHILSDSTILINGNVDYNDIKDIFKGMVLKKEC